MHPAATSLSAPVNIRRRIFEFIAEHHSHARRLPTQSEVRALFAEFTQDVDLHLEQLAREGLLILDKNGGNGISLVPTYLPAPQIEMLGQMAGQLAKRATPCNHTGSIALDLRGIGVSLEPGMSAVQVLDDRMSDAGIEYGDIALLVNTNPLRGDIVAVEEGDILVLRRYVIISGIPHFLAENSTAPDLRPGWESPMHGVLWGFLRVDPCRRHPRMTPFRKVLASACDASSQPEAIYPKQSAHAKEQSAWPRPPAGNYLNEAEGGYRLTEKVGAYDTWGACYSAD